MPGSNSKIKKLLSDINSSDEDEEKSASAPVLVRIEKCLHNATLSKVYVGKLGDEDIAIKICDDPEETRKEYKFHSGLDCPYIIKTYGLFSFPRISKITGKEESVPGIVTPLMRGDVKSYLKFMKLFSQEKGNPSGLDNNKILQILAGATMALDYLHDEEGYVYRDMKPDNLLIQNSFAKDKKVVKLCDFGTVQYIGVEDEECYPIGTPGYIAPEASKEECANFPARDMYSLGATLQELLTGPGPRYKMLPLTERCDPLFSQWAEDCQNADPKLRPTAGEMIRRIGNLGYRF